MSYCVTKSWCDDYAWIPRFLRTAKQAPQSLDQRLEYGGLPDTSLLVTIVSEPWAAWTLEDLALVIQIQKADGISYHVDPRNSVWEDFANAPQQ